MEPVKAERKYRAFFSYSRGDDKLAGKLHRALDSYKVPKELHRAEGTRGTVPVSLHPIFRDRDDLSGGGQLDERLQEALHDSDALIVLCTPNSASSHWVNQEILTFQQAGREADIFPVIGAGEPNAADPALECLPEALRDNELLAADLRNIEQDDGRIIGDGFDGGKLKLIAGLLGVDLDQLRRREDKRKRRLLAGAGVATLVFLALAVLSAILGVMAKRSADEAETQRLAAEKNATRAEENADRAERGEIAAQQNEARAVRGERLAEQRAEAEKAARAREAEQRRLAEVQRLLAERNADEAKRQASIALTNQKRAETQTAKAQLALAEAMTQGARLAAERGNGDTALRMALASGQISPDIGESQRVLLTRLTQEPLLKATLSVPKSDKVTFLALGPHGGYAMTAGLALTARLFKVDSGVQVDVLGRNAGSGSGVTKGTFRRRSGVTRTSRRDVRTRVGITRGLNADPAVGGTQLANNWFSPNGSLFLTAWGNGTFEIRRTQDGKLEGPPVQAHDNAVLSAGFSPDGRYLLTSSLDETVKVWQVETHELASVPLHIEGLRSATWGKSTSSIVTSSIVNGIELWQIDQFSKKIRKMNSNLGGSQTIGEVNETGLVRVIELGSNKLRASLSTGKVSENAYRISGDGRIAAVGRTDGSLVVWDIATRQKLAEFAAHENSIRTLALDNFGSALGSVSSDGELKIWNLAPLFLPLNQLVWQTCRNSTTARSTIFTEDERAADPMLEAIPMGRSVCPARSGVAAR